MFVCFLDAAAKDITGVKLYIESGKDLNVRDQMGYTALILGNFNKFLFLKNYTQVR